ncbi:hypothetical protein BSKO_01674 [Bryopsis sp. KO-2023]|nr:hypothetical protein BSKO_01674 [Bryopsis sp. KO-2023]
MISVVQSRLNVWNSPKVLATPQHDEIAKVRFGGIDSLSFMGSCHSVGPTLVQAASAGDADLVRRVLLRSPQYASYRSFKNKNSPLLAAAGRGHREILRFIHLTALSSVGYSRTRRCLDAQNIAGYTPLMAACKNGHASCVRYLVFCDASPLSRELSKGRNCLHLAAEGSHNGCIVQLLASGRIASVKVRQYGEWARYVDCPDALGMAPLHIAVRNGCISTVWCLLRWGASLDVVTTAGNGDSWLPAGSNVLHIAAAYGDTSLLKWLLDYQESHCPGIDLRQMENSAGRTPLECADRESNLARVLLEPSVPYSTISSMWRNRGLMQDRQLWRKDAAVALHRVQLLLKACAIASSQNENTAPNSRRMANLAMLAKLVTTICAALPDCAVSSSDAIFRRGFLSSGASIGAFQSIVQIASSMAKECVGDSGGAVASERLVLLTSLLEALLARVLQEKARKPGQPRHQQSLSASAILNPAFRSMFVQSASQDENFFSPIQCYREGDDLGEEAYENTDSKKSLEHETDETCACDGGSCREAGTCGVCKREGTCAICMDRNLDVVFEKCGHRMCLTCVVEICSTHAPKGSTYVKCPFCRQLVMGFKPLRQGQFGNGLCKFESRGLRGRQKIDGLGFAANS